MKKFTLICDFQGGQKAPFDFYIGQPEPDHHPLHFQTTWLSSARGGTAPADIMESLQKLYTLSRENNMNFEDLCFYAMSNADQEKEEDFVPDSAKEEESSENSSNENEEQEGQPEASE